MMSMHMCRRFFYLFSQNSSFLCKPHASLCVYLSTSHTFSESLIQKYKFHHEVVSQVAASVSTTLKNPQKTDKILSFFVDSGFSAAQLEKIFKSLPNLLSVNLDKIVKPKFKIFQDFGFSDTEIIEVISKYPSILHASADKRVVPSLSVLKGLLGSTGKVIEFSKVSGCYLRRDLDNSLLLNINLLTNCGVAEDKIFWLMYYFPRFMLLNPKILEKYIEKADQFGADRNSKMYVHSVRIAGSMRDDTWELKKKAFRDLGFSEDDIHQVFRLQPQVFAASEEKIKKASQVILATGKYDISCIVSSPTSLTRSIEKSYKPRFCVLEILEGKKLINRWPSLSTLHKMTNKKFFDKYVGPFYDEVGEVYVAMKADIVGKQERDSTL